MTIYRCDRCSEEMPESRVNKIEIRVNGSVQGNAELCLRCKDALADFLRPLPVAAEPKP